MRNALDLDLDCFASLQTIAEPIFLNLLEQQKREDDNGRDQRAGETASHCEDDQPATVVIEHQWRNVCVFMSWRMHECPQLN